MDAPCKDCTRREVGCHGKCESYVEWQKEHVEQKRQEKRLKQCGQVAAAYISDALRRMKK